jgi:uncharacterized protein YciI
MRNEPDRVRDVAARHARYWHDQNLSGYMGGPFADRSGGSISFLSETVSAAEELVAGDPFVAADLLSQSWLKEWQVE